MGAGRAGTVLAVSLARAGHRVTAASGRARSQARVERHLPGVPMVPAPEAAAAGDVVVLGVPDDLIATVCEEIAHVLRPAQWVLHLSGSAPLDELGAAKEAGAGVLSLHPLQTFAGVEDGLVRLPGSAIAVTADRAMGYAVGERLAEDAGGRPFRLNDERKPLYHAAAVFGSNYLVVVEAVAEDLLLASGVEQALGALSPLARGTLANVLGDGPRRALTGPAARGDVGTIRRNLEALAEHAPETVPAYVALASLAAGLAERIEPGTRARVEEALDEWR